MSSNASALYRRFAEIEADGVSELYAAWARGIAADDEALSLIEALPGPKRQPNLVFAAARWVGAPEEPYPVFRSWLRENWAAVVPVVMARTTQTNEAARAAVLLPVLSRLPGRLSLIEAGASAGLVLYPDRYSYRYDVGDETIALDPPGGPSDVVLPCRIDRASVPTRVPEVAWRAGVDLNPLDVRGEDDLRWLEQLVWPEHDARRARVRAAARLAAADPPRLEAGDLLDRIPELVAEAPAGTHVVVFHSAVLVYLRPERRAAFAETMRGLPGVTWISNEGEDVLPDVTRRLTRPARGRTVLAVDGEPVALVGPHGQTYEAL